MKRNIEYHRKKAQAFLAGMTLADKVTSFYGSGEELAKIGLVHYDFSGEAAHGVQARHDQSFDLGIPQYTTAFPNPIGMAASFDREMMHRIGEVVGIEMRSLLNEGRHSEGCGYAPTVDMERDSRWGRNEEAYGEDPCLTARMASEYILGMAGDDPDYVRAGATLKHFYGNNNEEERYTSDSRIPEELKDSYYVKVFRDIIAAAQPMSFMTAYNQVNGVTATFNPEAKALKALGVPFVVSDAHTLFFSVEGQHTATDRADAIKKAFTAGVDYFLEKDAYARPAMEEALSRGVITEEELDEAVLNRLTAWSMLGFMPEDREQDGCSKAFPLSEYNMSRVDTPAARALAREAAVKAAVLLKNTEKALPLKETPFLFGPFADRLPLDWYSALPSHRVTMAEGIASGWQENKEGINKAAYEALYPYVRIVYDDPAFESESSETAGDGSNKKFAGIRDGRVVPVPEEEAELFRVMLWDESRITIRSMSTGKLLTTKSPRTKQINVEEAAKEFVLYAAAEDAFSWFVNECFQMIDREGNVIRYSQPVREDASDAGSGTGVGSTEGVLRFTEDPRIAGIMNLDGRLGIRFETVKNAEMLMEEAAAAHQLKEDTAILACLGLHPLVNCKEERDRESIELPPYQRALLRRLRESYRNIHLVLLANAPLAIVEEMEATEIRSILWSATGSEELGNGLADILSGKVSPAGCLPQTWYRSDGQLPDIFDYDIRKNKMTYLYMEDEPLFRFGFGLTYTTFSLEVSDVQADGSAEEKPFGCRVRIKNTGDFPSDAVLQLYETEGGRKYVCDGASAGTCPDGTRIPVGARLVSFTRVPGIAPGEEREVDFLLKCEQKSII